MKKIIISTTIALMSLSLVGCNSKNNSDINRIDELQTTINELQIKIDNLEEKTNKLTNKVDLKSYYERENSSVEISKSYLPNLEDYNEMIESLKEKFEAEGKTVIYPEKAIGNRVIILTTSTLIKNVSLSEFNNRFITEFECNASLYFNELGIDNSGNLSKTLSSNDVLIFTAREPEGIPSHYISWTELDGSTVYAPVLYNGKSDIN